jgi:hypothetical protein
VNIGPFEPDRHQQKKKSSTRANSATTVKIHTIEDISRAQQRDDGEKFPQPKPSPEPSKQRDDGEKLPADYRSHPQSQASTTTG